jgi:glycosyltransferase involved in cell wall biosynthesis
MNKPDVSIICLTYNHRPFIREAIDSFLSQVTSYTYEIIVCDDASPDKTGSYVSEIYRDVKSVRLFSHESNLGVLRNLIFGFKKARGRYIMLCEGDDFWVSSKKIQTHLDFLEKNLEYFGAYSSALVIDESGNNIKKIPLERKSFRKIGDFLRTSYTIPTCTVTFRNEFKGNIFRFRHLLKSTNYIVDYLIDSVICLHGEYKFINHTLGCYRVTKNTDSFSSQSIQDMEVEMIGTRKKLADFLDNKFYLSLLVSEAFVYFSIIVKYNKISRISAIKRFLRLSMLHKCGVILVFLRYLYLFLKGSINK